MRSAKTSCFVVLLGLLALGSSPAAAETVQLAPVADTSLFQNDTEASSGAGPVLFSGFAGSRARRALLRFDVAAAIPVGSTIDVATLTLTVVSAGPAATPGDVFALHRVALGGVSQEWGEGGSDSGNSDQGAPAQAGDATWDLRVFPTDPWSTPGGSFPPTPVTSQTVGLSGTVTFGGAAVVDLVDDWLYDNTSNKKGLFLLGESSGPVDMIRGFGSRESDNPPVLTVEFTPPPPIAGAVPDGFRVSGAPMRVGPHFQGTLLFSWDPGCQREPDYALYGGLIGQFYDHGLVACSTSGQLELGNVPADPAAGEYFLIVPVSSVEGSHGFDSEGNERPRGTGPSCPIPQLVADPVCPL